MSEGIEALMALNQLGFACTRCRERPADFVNQYRQVCKSCRRENEAAYESVNQPEIALHLGQLVREWVHLSRKREAVASTIRANRPKLHHQHVDEKLPTNSKKEAES